MCLRMKEARERLALTQEQCSTMLDIPRGTLSNYEYCKAPVRVILGLRFCQRLLVSEEWLAVGSGPVEPCIPLYVGDELIAFPHRLTYRDAFINHLSDTFTSLKSRSPEEWFLSLLRTYPKNAWRSERILKMAIARWSGVLDKIGTNLPFSDGLGFYPDDPRPPGDPAGPYLADLFGELLKHGFAYVNRTKFSNAIVSHVKGVREQMTAVSGLPTGKMSVRRKSK